MKIGVFDSGIGGITVLRELVRRFCGAEFVYVGDNAHIPYGTKSAQQVERLSVACVEKLLAQKVELIVIACNTASSVAIEKIRDVAGSLPVLGVVEAGIAAVMSELKSRTCKSEGPSSIVICGTRATVKSGIYGRSLRARLNQRDLPPRVYEQACPLLVPMIEEGWLHHPILQETVREYLRLYRKYENGILLLACTHYPWIRTAFESTLPGWTVIDSAMAVAESMASLLPTSFVPQNIASQPAVEWIFTDADSAPADPMALLTEDYKSQKQAPATKVGISA